MSTKHIDYHAYLLRLWRNGEEESWRASLQSTATEQFQHFADVEALFDFLLAQLRASERECKPEDEPNNDIAE